MCVCVCVCVRARVSAQSETGVRYTVAPLAVTSFYFSTSVATPMSEPVPEKNIKNQ